MNKKGCFGCNQRIAVFPLIFEFKAHSSYLFAAHVCISYNQNFRQLFYLPTCPMWLPGRRSSAVQRVMANGLLHNFSRSSVFGRACDGFDPEICCAPDALSVPKRDECSKHDTHVRADPDRSTGDSNGREQSVNDCR